MARPPLDAQAQGTGAPPRTRWGSTSWAAAVAVVVLLSTSAQAHSLGARHFADANGDLPHEPITAVLVDPRDDDVVFAGLDGFLFKSDDGGGTWRVVLSFPRGVALQAVVDGGAGAGIATGADGLNVGNVAADLQDDLDDPVFLEDNLSRDELPDGALDISDVDPADLQDAADLPSGGDSSSGLGDPNFLGLQAPRSGPGVRRIFFAQQGKGVLLVATPHGLYASVDDGESFIDLALPEGAAGRDVRDVVSDPRRPSRLYVGTAAGLFISKDGGASFASAPGRSGNTPVVALDMGVVQQPRQQSVLLVGTEAGLFRLADDGGPAALQPLEPLEALLRGASPFTPVTAVAFDEGTGNAYAGTSRGLFVAERGAALFERYPAAPADAITALSPDPSRAGAVAIGTARSGVLFSFDAGLTLEEVASAPAREVIALARPRVDHDVLYAATDRGLFKLKKGSGIIATRGSIEVLKRRFAKEPGLQAVADVALRRSGVQVLDLTSLVERARYASFLPSVQVRYTGRIGRRDEADQFVFRVGELPPFIDPDNDQVDQFGNVGVAVLAPREGFAHRGWLQLTWELDRVVFNERELRAVRRLPQQAQAERAVLGRVEEAWAARRRLLAELILQAEPPDGRALVPKLLRLAELTAQLDALTGGSFSDACRRQGFDPDEPETP